MRLLCGVQPLPEPARGASTSPPPGPLVQFMPPRYRRITPGITRRPEPFAEHDSRRVGGRVHAVVMRHSGRLYRRLRAYPAMIGFSTRAKSRSRSNASGVPILYKPHVHLRASAYPSSKSKYA